MNPRFFPVLLAASLLLPVAARADEMDDALAALHTRSVDPPTVPDTGDYGRRPGWVSKDRESKLLDPFRPLTTEQARKVVPKLIEMLKSEEIVFGNPMGMEWGVANRAHEALGVIAFEQFGRISRGGELKSPEGYKEERRQFQAALTGWAKWWEENKAKEVSEWRRARLKEALAALNARAKDAAEAARAIAVLAERGFEMRRLLTKEESAIVLVAARDTGEGPETRIAAVRLAYGAGLPETLQVAEEFAVGRQGDAAPSDEGFDILAALGHKGWTRLVALLRKTAVSAEGALSPENEALYAAAQKRLGVLAPDVNAGTGVPGARMARIMVVGRYEEWLAKAAQK